MASKLSGTKMRGDLALKQQGPSVIVENPSVRDSCRLVFATRFFSRALLFDNLKFSFWCGAAGCPTGEPLEQARILRKRTDKRVRQAVLRLLVLVKYVAHRMCGSILGF